MSKLAFFVLVMTLHACMLVSSPLPTPEDGTEEETAGILERAKQAYRETKAKVLNVGSTVADFAGMYYEEHFKTVTDSYIEWARDRASSWWERLRDKVPTFRST